KTAVRIGEICMTSVTLALPEPIYRQIERRAHERHSSIEDALLTVVAEALPDLDALPTELEQTLAELAYLTDDELWQAARAKLAAEENQAMQELILKKQAGVLTQSEAALAQQLLQKADRVMLIRAQAAVLLKERGHDISSLGPNAVAP
ncbi:MAG: hypothetical protein KDE46_25135, partial [Caldilineaceae bacterium]|nr:hypothetical protein [Caldilineaceae bacterium]